MGVVTGGGASTVASTPRRRGVVAAVSAVLVVGGAIGSVARAEPDGHMAHLSGPRTATVAGCGTGAAAGFEGDHVIAAGPTGRDLVAVWSQDGESSIGFARSTDGGRTWDASTVPGFTTCDGAGGPFAFAFDASSSIGPDGTTYVAAAVVTASPVPPDPAGGYGVVVASTDDGGASWRHAVVSRSLDLVPTDKPTVTADPARPGRAWVSWTEISVVGGTSVTRIARTDDGGRTWSEPSLLLPASPLVGEFGSVVLPLPDDVLLRTFSRFAAQPLAAAGRWIGGGTTIVAAWSRDGGRTWQEADIAHVPDSVLRDPETGADLASGIPFVVADVAADGNEVAVAWAETTPAGRVRVARSSDGGRTWSPEVVATSLAPVFRASVALGRGRLAVTWSDLGGDVPGDGELTTTTWLATDQAGEVWRRRAIGPTHDLRRSTTSSGTAVPGGDYWGLAFDGLDVVAGMNLPGSVGEPHGDLHAWIGH